MDHTWTYVSSFIRMIRTRITFIIFRRKLPRTYINICCCAYLFHSLVNLICIGSTTLSK